MNEPLRHLSDEEGDAVRRYLGMLHDLLAEELVEVRLFGSAARGDLWPASSSMRSDIDLLVLTRDSIEPGTVEEIAQATYPLFLETGRQISPTLRTIGDLESPEDEKQAAFYQRVREEGAVLWRADVPEEKPGR